MGARSGNVQSVEEACGVVGGILDEMVADVTFGLVYLRNEGKVIVIFCCVAVSFLRGYGNCCFLLFQLILQECANLDSSHPAAIKEIPISDSGEDTLSWPVNKVLHERAPMEVSNLDKLFSCPLPGRVLFPARFITLPIPKP